VGQQAAGINLDSGNLLLFALGLWHMVPINNKGSVTGFAFLPGDAAFHAFLWRKGVMTDLEAISCFCVRRSGAFASDNHVLRASPTVVDIVAYVENFPPASLNIAF
jgi:probable HAF family extracellular repeat protein